MDHYQYIALLAACVLLTAPLEIAFDARVYRRPRRLLRALAPAVAVFYAWDAVAIGRHHWTFNAAYVTGWVLPFGVPVEEAAFFVVIPICALLSFEAVRNLRTRGWADLPLAVLVPRRRGASAVVVDRASLRRHTDG